MRPAFLGPPYLHSGRRRGSGSGRRRRPSARQGSCDRRGPARGRHRVREVPADLRRRAAVGDRRVGGERRDRPVAAGRQRVGDRDPSECDGAGVPHHDREPRGAEHQSRPPTVRHSIDPPDDLRVEPLQAGAGDDDDSRLCARPRGHVRTERTRCRCEREGESSGGEARRSGERRHRPTVPPPPRVSKPSRGAGGACLRPGGSQGGGLRGLTSVSARSYDRRDLVSRA